VPKNRSEHRTAARSNAKQTDGSATAGFGLGGSEPQTGSNGPLTTGNGVTSTFPARLTHGRGVTGPVPGGPLGLAPRAARCGSASVASSTATPHGTLRKARAAGSNAAAYAASGKTVTLQQPTVGPIRYDCGTERRTGFVGETSVRVGRQRVTVRRCVKAAGMALRTGVRRWLLT